MARYRNRRASRLAFAVLAGVSVIAITIWAVRSGTADAKPNTPVAQNAPPAAPAPEGQLTQTQPKIELLNNGNDGAHMTPPTTTPPAPTPTTVPTTGPSGTRPLPSGDTAEILKNASAKRDAGDLVTARDMVNDCLAASHFSGTDLQAAKTFVGELNDKIILGTQKFTADPYNKEWKVEPGTVLVKLAKRFDVTAELLCRVNGLSSPSKLKSGVTIKTIQGPFHLVVSKSQFTADVYLGAPGGPGSMYVKTLRVGLGADGSTPTGTWQVDTGKVVNPVYYSARGEGVIAADDPKNPLGERWIPLKGIAGDCVGKESYGIHGTIDPSSIGKNMSQGCIRLQSDDINLLYDLLIEGKSTVKVVD